MIDWIARSLVRALRRRLTHLDLLLVAAIFSTVLVLIPLTFGVSQYRVLSLIAGLVSLSMLIAHADRIDGVRPETALFRGRLALLSGSILDVHGSRLLLPRGSKLLTATETFELEGHEVQCATAVPPCEWQVEVWLRGTVKLPAPWRDADDSRESLTLVIDEQSVALGFDAPPPPWSRHDLWIARWAVTHTLVMGMMFGIELFGVELFGSALLVD